jgi:hypothetical protein
MRNPVGNLAPYELDHLILHLAEAGRTQDIHRLLALEDGQGHNAWYEAKIARGNMGGYMADLARAWQIVDAVSGTNWFQNVGLQVRYALMMASINSIAGQIPPELAARLVEHGIWTAPESLAYIRQAQNTQQRAEALTALTPHLPEAMQSRILAETLEILPILQGKSYGNFEDQARAKLLADLAPRLDEALLGKALRTLDSIKSDKSRGEALTALAPHLPASLWTEALRQAWAIASPYERVPTLQKLAAFLSEPLAQDTLCAGRSYWQAQPTLTPDKPGRPTSEWSHVETDAKEWISLLPLLLDRFAAPSAEVLHEALELASAITVAENRAAALTSLVSRLPLQLRPQALSRGFESAYQIPDLGLRAETLIRLVSLLPGSKRKAVIPRILTVIHKIQDEQQRIALYVMLAPHLPETNKMKILQEALNLARASDWHEPPKPRRRVSRHRR